MANTQAHTNPHTHAHFERLPVSKRLGLKAISVLTMAARWRDLYDGACGDFITRCMRATLGDDARPRLLWPTKEKRKFSLIEVVVTTCDR